MKYLPVLLFASLLILAASCSKDEDNNDQLTNSGLVGTWNMTSSSGGFAGITCSYQLGELVLVFDAEDKLTITNNVLNTSAICGGQEVGATIGDHKYGVLTSNEKKYLLVDDLELGEIVVTTDQFTLNQNSSSEGSGADGYFTTFVK